MACLPCLNDSQQRGAINYMEMVLDLESSRGLSLRVISVMDFTVESREKNLNAGLVELMDSDK